MPIAFVDDVEKFVGYIRQSPLEDGAPAIRMPGENGFHESRRRAITGIPLQPFTINRLRAIREPARRRVPHAAGRPKEK